ncbi:HinT-interacting membrane complex lipoprotein P60 [[Mycoplasma] collis]|uniref:HinT-interacting membrane complex lipoprotein P60 n=1 Tax=[Mycoplasma] collis TaxID=2127 RepID=UPI00051AB638|nr:hypothetical protein [[Mycoplasma] collis]
MKKNKLNKIFVSGILLTPFILSSCSQTVSSSSKIIEDEKLKSNEVKEFLENKVVEQILMDKWYKSDKNLAQQFLDSNSQYYKDAKNAFEYYQNFNLKTNDNFTSKIITDLIGKNLVKDNEIQTLLNDAGPQKIFSENSFKILFNISESQISSKINKMLLNLNHLSNINKEDIQSSKIYKDAFDETKNQFNQKEIFENIDINSKDFFLINLLLNKKVAQTWSYKSEDPSDVHTLKFVTVKDENDFNFFIPKDKQNLETTKLIKDFELYKLNDSIDVKKLFGYKGLLYNQNGFSKYGVSYRINELKKQPYIKSGFLDTNTLKFVSKKDLESANLWKDKKAFPVKIKSNFNLTKTSSEVTKDDLEIKTSSDVSGVKYEIERIVPIASSSNVVDALVKMTIDSNGKTYNNYYWAEGLSWNSTTIFTNTQYPENGKELSKLPEFVSFFDEQNDNSFLSLSYILPITPLFNKEVTQNKIKKIYFSFNETPWNTKEEKEKLIHNLYLADEINLFNEVKEFYEEKGYKLELVDSVLKQLEEQNKDNQGNNNG